MRSLRLPGKKFTQDAAAHSRNARAIEDWATLISKYLFFGTGDPEGNVIANIGSLYGRLDGGAGTTLYVKESGTGTDTGWIAK